MYNSVHKSLFQAHPLDFDPDKIHKPYGWTRSLKAYLNSATKERTLLLRNEDLLKKSRGYGYTFAATINFRQYLAPAQITKEWQKMARKLRRAGVVAYFVREPTKHNCVHHHLIISSQHTQAELTTILDSAKSWGIKCATHCGKEIENTLWWSGYILKTKISRYAAMGKGHEPTATSLRQRFFADLYRTKRLLFVPHLPFNKVGSIGSFWVASKAKIWKQVIGEEKQIAEGLKDPLIKKCCEWLAEELGEPLSTMRRRVGLNGLPDSWLNHPSFLSWKDEH